MSDDFVIYVVVILVGMIAGGYAGYIIRYAYGVKVSHGFNLVNWLKSLLPFGKF